MGTEIPRLDMSRAQPTEGRDEQDRPTIILNDGTTEIVLFGGDDRHENLGGASRIMGALFDYQQRHAAERLAEEPITVTYSQGGVSEASVVDLIANEERIAELRGSSPSVSGAY